MPAIPALDRLRQTLAQSLPYCGGTFVLPADSFELYYGKETAKFLNLGNAANSHAALDSLQSACEPARFGRNTETVLDETYRKAGKMDTSEFLIRMDVVQSGLLDVVCSSLLSGDKSRRNVTAELYKLNVYGEGAFFKSHTDTPTSGNMFGSLVVVFPTPHSGGTLVLRHHEHEWTFDSATLLAGTPNRIAYAAFFSDVEHEVTPVTSGHRITITYNLYWADSESDRKVTAAKPDGINILQPLSANTADVGRVLSEVMEETSLLPAGGTLGFGLRHAYPFPRTWDPYIDGKDPLDGLPALLKGSDLALFEACKALGLQPELKFISDAMDEDEKPVLLDRAIQLCDTEVHESAESVMLEDHNGVIMEEVSADFKPSDAPEDMDKTVRPVYWVTEVGEMNKLASAFIHYGNQGVLSHLYMTACLTVEVGPVGDRKASGN
ncbi:hypothetical protein K466DRAFT_568440 [Polyporus arcularius HHB13444]|uniref:Fe2OG dioxygenase domain-containing protein n=1 Tax=Polyporus arcularius HHB13444 TaxID=1314778 RepID=A0A5C3NZA6_9APHY|nr:hypothetical protein K466DRAFT_568440 [Polyporus arcularius HHB13444]